MGGGGESQNQPYQHEHIQNWTILIFFNLNSKQVDDTYKNFSTRMDKYREKVNQQIYVFNPIFQNDDFAIIGSNDRI